MSELEKGAPAPRFELRGIDNQVRTLEADHGPEGTFLFFYQRDHVDSRRAFSLMERLARCIGHSRGILWGVTSDGHSESLEVADSFQLSFPILLDRRGWVREAYGVKALPAFVHMGPDLTILGAVQGLDEADVRALGRTFASSLGLESEGLFEEEDWLPGA
jgi:peroxiredoxin